VFLRGVLLGTTPFEKKLPAAAKELLAWRLDGHANKSTTAVFAEGARVTTTLAPKPAEKPAEEPAEKPADLKAGGLMNPFAKKK
jgi:hypothetical protein